MSLQESVFTLFIGVVLGFGYIAVPLWVALEEKKKAEARGLPLDFLGITFKVMVAMIFSVTVTDKLFLGTLQSYGIDVQKYERQFIAWGRGDVSPPSPDDIRDTFEDIWERWGMD